MILHIVSYSNLTHDYDIKIAKIDRQIESLNYVDHLFLNFTLHHHFFIVLCEWIQFKQFK